MLKSGADRPLLFKQGLQNLMSVSISMIVAKQVVIVPCVSLNNTVKGIFNPGHGAADILTAYSEAYILSYSV